MGQRKASANAETIEKLITSLTLIDSESFDPYHLAKSAGISSEELIEILDSEEFQTELKKAARRLTDLNLLPAILSAAKQDLKTAFSF